MPKKNPTTTRNPILPTGEQESLVLARLKRGPLTPLEALRQLGVYRLAAVVLRLRDAGWPVVTELEKKRCRSGRVTRVARYYLDRNAGGARC